jgi:4-alpha-glucanotransferase
LDHFIGFIRVYEVPAPAKNALHGTYQPSAGPEFFEKIQSALGELPFIVDNLGSITSEVEALREQFSLPGSRVLEFEWDPTINALPATLKPSCSLWVVYTSTHDNDTVMGWYRGLKLEEHSQSFNWDMIQAAYSSSAILAIIPMQDILGLGSNARMNYPGKKQGNWKWRMQAGCLTEVLASRLFAMAHEKSRLTI